MLGSERLTEEHLELPDVEEALEELYLEPEEEEAVGDEEIPAAEEVALQAEALFHREVGRTTLLSREDEERLAQGIVQARQRIRCILREAPQLSTAALGELGRGVITPDEDFREREAVAVLQYAEQLSRTGRGGSPIGIRPDALRALVDELGEALLAYRVLRDRMVEANLRLVTLFARRRHRSSLTFLDFIQEGTLGLIRAIEKYEPSRNVKFSTYAIYWIWQQIARAVDTQGALIRTPVHWNQFRRKFSRELLGEASETQSAEEWAAAEGLDPVRARQMAQSFQFISTDASLDDEDDRTFGSVLASEEGGPERRLLESDLRRRLAALVERLPSREAEIMRRRFGLSTESETLEEVGARFGVSRERIRQLETRALKRLRELCHAEGLQDYLQ